MSLYLRIWDNLPSRIHIWRMARHHCLQADGFSNIFHIYLLNLHNMSILTILSSNVNTSQHYHIHPCLQIYHRCIFHITKSSNLFQSWLLDRVEFQYLMKSLHIPRNQEPCMSKSSILWMSCSSPLHTNMHLLFSQCTDSGLPLCKYKVHPQ